MASNEKSVKLRGGLEKTATWLKITSDGELIVDYYDFSNEAQDTFGNDIASVLTIKPQEKIRILQLLSNSIEVTNGESSTDELLLKLMSEKFDSYFAIENWLQTNGIEYQQHYDAWA